MQKVVLHNFIEKYQIHEFTILESTLQAVQQYHQCFDKIYDDYLNKASVRFMLDVSSSGMLPIRANEVAIKETFKKYPHFPVTYLAYLTSSKMDYNLINLLNYNPEVRQNNRQVFDIKDKDKAIEWLLSKAID